MRGLEQQIPFGMLLLLVLAVAAFDGVEEFGGIVAYAVFEDDFDFFDVVDVGGGVAVDDDTLNLAFASATANSAI